MTDSSSSECNVTRTVPLTYVYARVQLTFHNFKADITETVYRGSIQSALQALYGATGGQLDWAVLQHQAGAGIVKVAARDYTRFAAAAAWLSEYSGRSCRLVISAASCSLSGLSSDSRKYLQQLLA